MTFTGTILAVALFVPCAGAIPAAWAQARTAPSAPRAGHAIRKWGPSRFRSGRGRSEQVSTPWCSPIVHRSLAPCLLPVHIVCCSSWSHGRFRHPITRLLSPPPTAMELPSKETPGPGRYGAAGDPHKPVSVPPPKAGFATQSDRFGPGAPKYTPGPGAYLGPGSGPVRKSYNVTYGA